MNWDNFKDFFHPSYWKKMQPFIESEECNKIYRYLKETGKRRKIAPLSSQVFRCFKETPLDEVKVVMMGLCPYHTTRDNKIVADGLLMGCSSTGHIQPSLDKFFDGVAEELYKGKNVKWNKNSDVSYLARQGVLMCNASLTVEVGKPGSHLPLWESFMKYLFEEVINTSGMPVIFLGKESAKLEKYLLPFTWVFKVSHPASASYAQAEWDTEGVFSKVNKVLYDNNKFTIKWLDEESNEAPF